jgi:hypothetical protein
MRRLARHSWCLFALSFAGCAANSNLPDGGGDAGTGSPDAGDDAGNDAGAERDAGAVLPERCSSEHMFFMDEFGREAYCIYVAESGNDDTGEGTPTAPFRSIGHGLEVAVARGVATGRIHAVAVSRGTYSERVVLVNGVSIYGGFDAEDGWSRNETNETIVVSAAVVDGRMEGVVADSISAPTVVERLTVRVGSMLLADLDVDLYGVRVVGSTPVLPDLGGLVLRDLVVEVGDASDGVDGTPGAVGDDGEQGERGDAGGTSDGNPNEGGLGAVSTCGVVTVESTRGGEGGVGGGDGAMGCGTFQASATAGLPPPALLTCVGGTVGDACGCVSDPGAAGGPGNTCAVDAADDGLPAVASPIRGTIEGGVWLGRAGDPGADGDHGIGGSGGGGGGSGCNAGGWGPTGGGGGGGGSGGCGGLGGVGGHSGGSSFGLFAVDSTFAVPGSSFTSGGAGIGGDGALGGEAGDGGPGGPGGTGGFSGGVGGRGQAGGAGGTSAAGPGGSSVGAMLCRSDVAELDLPSLTEGTAGTGGAAAEGGVEGLDGVASPVSFGCQL